MEKGKREMDLVGMVVNPETFLPDLSRDMVRRLNSDAEILLEEFDKQIAIMYIAGNYSSNKHLCATILGGRTDDEIKEILLDVIDKIEEELESRKRA